MILCFLKKENIKQFQKVIINKISTDAKLKLFLKYLENYLFKLDPSLYNYENLITYKNNNENKYIDKLYLTNNVVESINAKLNYYLPKKSTDNNTFITSITKVLINNIINILIYINNKSNLFIVYIYNFYFIY